MTHRLRILLVEDSAEDAELILHKLHLSGYEPVWSRVDTAESLRVALDEPWDIIVAGYAISGFEAFAALDLVKELELEIPLIIVFSTVDEETAVAAMKAGAQDYIVKGYWARLIPVITRAIAETEIRGERKQAQRELEAHTRHLILLNDITKAASGMLDFEQMLQVLADRLGELLNADGCYLTLWDEKRQRPIPAAAYGSLRNIYSQVEVLPDEHTLTAYVLQSGEALAVEETEKSPHLSSRIVNMFPSRAILALPLIVAEQKLGAALISFDRPYVFSQDEIRSGEQAAGQIALAIAKAKLLDSERKQRELAETLREITHVLISSLEPAEVLELILDQLARVLAYHSASVFKMVGNELHKLVTSTIYEEVNNPNLVMEKFRHIVEVMASRQPLIIENTETDSRWQTLPGKSYTRCWLGVPLIAHNQIIGLLNITHGEPYFYEQRDAQIAMAFANQAAVAIDNANLYERLRHHAQNLEIEVTERTHELAEANERLKELDRLKTKFISDVSHELRTPVTNLKLYLSLVEHGDPQKREHYLGVINQQTGRLEILIEDILDISRLEVSNKSMIFKLMNLNDLVDRTIDLHKQRASLGGLQLNFQPDIALPLVSGDASKLQQVVENLIVNAIQYTYSGSVDVYTYADLKQQMICLQVADTGMGVSLNERPLIYDRFYRGESTSRSNVPGTGLGLSIVNEIVGLHNGRIELQSELGKGSTFRVWLPISQTIQETKDDETTSMA